MPGYTILNISMRGWGIITIHLRSKTCSPERPWRQAIGFRHIAIHEYHNWVYIWFDLAVKHLPELKGQMLKQWKEMSQKGKKKIFLQDSCFTISEDCHS